MFRIEHSGTKIIFQFHFECLFSDNGQTLKECNTLLFFFVISNGFHWEKCYAVDNNGVAYDNFKRVKNLRVQTRRYPASVENTSCS